MNEPLELAQDFLEQVWQRGKTEWLAQHCADDFTDYSLPESEDGDIAQLEDHVLELREAFPDLKVELGDSFQDVEYAILRLDFRGTQRGAYKNFDATKQRVEWSSIEIFHFENDQLLERWMETDLIAKLHAAAQESARLRIEACWDRLNAHLAHAGPHVCGAQYSMADMLGTMLMRWSRNMPRPATEWPHCRALAERVRARPAWRRLYEVEGLTEWA